MIWFAYYYLVNKGEQRISSGEVRQRKMEVKAMSVKKIIDEWASINLLEHAPDDEYLSEVFDIAELVKPSEDLEFIADAIYSVFNKSFRGVLSKTKDECREIAK